jgi:hypothetical protein
MLIYGLLFRLVGLTSYVPYVAVLIAAHLAVIHLMWRVALRGGVQPWIATAFSAAFIPFGPGADNLLWAFQIGFVGSVALGLAATLIADRARGSLRRDAVGWGTNVLALTFSGISVPLVGASAVAAWMRRGFKAFLITVSVPAAVYLLWVFTSGSEGLGAIAPVTADSLGVFPEFVQRGVTAMLSIGTSTILTGAVPLALTAVAIVLRRRQRQPLPFAALAAAVGEVLLLLMLAIGRAPFGLESADATRHVYIAGALLVPLLLVGLSDLLGRRLVGVLLVVALAVPWGVHNARLLIQRADLQSGRERLIREQFVAAGTLFDPAEVLRTRPDPVYSLDLHLPELERLLPSFPQEVSPSREAVIRAALALQVSLSPTPVFDAPVRLEGLRFFDASGQPEPNGCEEGIVAGPNPRLLLPAGTPSSLQITPARAVELELLLSAGGLRPDYKDRFPLRAGETRYLNSAIDERLVGGATLIVRFPGRILICPVDAAAGEP